MLLPHIRLHTLAASAMKDLTPELDPILLGPTTVSNKQNAGTSTVKPDGSSGNLLHPDDATTSPLNITDQLAAKDFKTLNVSETVEKKKKPKKLVGFAPEPEEDLREHHKYLEHRKKENSKSNPLGKLPENLAYLYQESRREGLAVTRPLPPLKTSKNLKLKDIPDRPSRPVKEISVANSRTVMNFHYFEIKFPLPSNMLLVDVLYASVSTLDMGKLIRSTYNLFDEKVGLGYNFVGVVSKAGRNYKLSEFAEGTKVFGVVNPALRKGVLQTCIALGPLDHVVAISEEDFSVVESVEVRFKAVTVDSFAVEDQPETDEPTPPDDDTKHSKLKLPAKASYVIEDVLTPMAKFATFGSLYCRAKQALQTIEKAIQSRRNANVLINGADTCLGFTIMQVLASSLYIRDLLSFHVIAVVQNKNCARIQALISQLGPSNTRRFTIVRFDEVNGDLYLRGEVVPIKYKNTADFTFDVVQAVLADHRTPATRSNADPRLDLFVDIIGSRKMFQVSKKLCEIPSLNNETVLSVFSKEKEPLYMILMKPKSSGCAYVAYRDFHTPEPTYLMDPLSSETKTLLNPWSYGWALGIANLFVSRYNYYEKNELEARSEWLREALQLVRNGELKMVVDKVVDWRNNFRREISRMQATDGCIVFKIETF